MSGPVAYLSSLRADRRMLTRLRGLEDRIPGVLPGRILALDLSIELARSGLTRLQAPATRPLRDLRLRLSLARTARLLRAAALDPLAGRKLRRVYLQANTLAVRSSTRRFVLRHSLQPDLEVLTASVLDWNVGLPHTPELKVFNALAAARDNRLLDPSWTLAWLVLAARPLSPVYDMTIGAYPELLNALLRARTTALRLDAADPLTAM